MFRSSQIVAVPGEAITRYRGVRLSGVKKNPQGRADRTHTNLNNRSRNQAAWEMTLAELTLCARRGNWVGPLDGIRRCPDVLEAVEGALGVHW